MAGPSRTIPRPASSSPLVDRIGRIAVALPLLVPGVTGLWGGDLRAQEVELRLTPSVGWFLPASRLYESDLPPAEAELGGAPALGVGLHAVPVRGFLSYRATVQRIFSLETRVTGRNPLVGVPEEGWPTYHYTVPTTITTVTGDLLFHPDRREFRTDIYLFVGLGWKWYDFGEEEPPDEVGFKFPDDGASGRIHYGAGLEIGLGRIPLAAEVGGSFNRFVLVDEEQGLSRSRSQHEFVLSLQAPLGILSF